MYYCITLILSRHLKHQFTPGQPSMPIPVLIYPFTNYKSDWRK